MRLGSLIRRSGQAPWGAIALACALIAAVVAGFERHPVFDAQLVGYRDSVQTFAAGARDIEIDAGQAGGRIPYVLPGPADAWAGGTPHSLRFHLPPRPARRLTLYLDAAETHHVSPPVLSVSLDGHEIRRLQTRPGTGLPPPHRDRGVRSHYTVRIPLPAGGGSGQAVLAMTNVAGSWVMWERLRLVEDRAFALANLGLGGGLPWPSAVTLMLSLALVVVARRRAAVVTAVVAVSLLLLSWAQIAPEGEPLAPVPRWVWLVLPALLLVTTGEVPGHAMGLAARLVLDPRRGAAVAEMPKVTVPIAVTAMLPLWLAVTILLLRDLYRRFAHVIWGADLDGTFNLWSLAWTSHALLTAPFRLFDGNIFYPARDTLALSDHRFADQLFFLPAYVLTSSPIVANNVVTTVQFVLTALATSLLAHHLFGSWRGAMLAGAMVAFSPSRIPTQLVHPQTLSLFWTPFALLFFDRFLASRARRDLWLFTACALGQMLASFFLGYALLVALAIWTLGRAILARPPGLAASLLKAAGGMVAIAPVMWLFGRPYLRVRAEYGTLQERYEFFRLTSADGLASYFAVHPASLLYGRLLSPTLTGFPWEKWLFPGFLCLALAILALAVSVRRSTCGRWVLWTAWGLVAVFGLLSLGPEIRLGSWSVPSPYVLLWHVLPGFTSFRVPARFGMLTAFALSLAAAGGYRWLEERLRAARSAVRGIAFVLLLAGVVLEAAFHSAPQLGPLPTPAEVPGEYRWLAEHGVGALLELPVGGTGDAYRDLGQQTTYMYLSLYHWRPLVNGFSGHTPKTDADVAERVKALPAPESLAYLRAIGVRQLLLHPESPLHSRAHALFGDIPGAAITSFPNRSLVVTLPDIARGDSLSVRLLVPGRLPPDQSRTFGVLFANPGDAYWVNAEQRACRVQVTWAGPGGRLVSESAPVLPPVALAAGEMQDRPVELTVPRARGPVTLASVVSCDRRAGGRQDWTGEASVTLVSEVPARGEEVGLMGGYVPPEACVGCPVLVRAHVKNTGRGRVTRDGPVRLAVQWRGVDGTALGGQVLPIRDLDPGDEGVVSLTIPAPPDPGRYELWLDVVREPLGGTGSAPGLRRGVTVLR